MTQDENKNQIAKELSNDPLERIKQLEQLQIATEQQAEADKKKLLLELADRVEANKKARKNEADALRKAEVAEYKYINQQQQQIDGITNLLNNNETDPDRAAKRIFVERLTERRKASQETLKNKQDNIYFL